MGDHRTAADELRHRGHEPHAVTDDALDDVGLREGAGQELGRGRELGDVLRVAQSVRHDRRRHDDRRVAAQLRVAHVLERLADLERDLVLVPVEGDPRLAPQPRQEVEVHAVLGEAVLVVEDLVLVEVALHEDADLLAGEAHDFDPEPRDAVEPALSQSDSRSAIIRIPAWQLPDGTTGMTLASATRRPGDAADPQLRIDDSEVVGPHLAGARLVVVRVGGRPDEGPQLVVGLRVVGRHQLLRRPMVRTPWSRRSRARS